MSEAEVNSVWLYESVHVKANADGGMNDLLVYGLRWIFSGNSEPLKALPIHVHAWKKEGT